MDLKITIDWSEPSDYYVLLHDFETDLWNHKPRSLFSDSDGLQNDKGYPETVPFVNRIGTLLTKEILWFMFDLCLLSQYGFTYKSRGWGELTVTERRKAASEFETAFDSGRFITNGTGIDKYYNPIGEEILGQAHREKLAKMWEVSTGGNIIRAVSHDPVSKIATDIDGVRRWTPCLEVEVWDGQFPQPSASVFNRDTHPHLIHEATISTPFGFNGEVSQNPPWKVNPFPFFGGNGTPFPLLFSSPNFVPTHRVRRLKVGEVAHLYYP